MNEDDTYKALKRIPFKQMYDLWDKKTEFLGKQDNDFYIPYGWTRLEFHYECNEIFNDRKSHL